MLTGIVAPQDWITARKAFIRGCVTSGLIAVTEYRRGQTSAPAIARRSLKSGLAVASGTMTVNALERGDLLRAALFMGSGTLCMATIDSLLSVVDTTDAKHAIQNKQTTTHQEDPSYVE